MHFKLLKEPHPFISNNWGAVISISIFISLFMYVFEPFGMNLNTSENKIWIELGYGLVTFVVLTIFLILLPLILKSSLSEQNWTIGKEFLWLSAILFVIGIGNFLYTTCVVNANYSYLLLFLAFQFYTYVVGIILLTIVLIIERNILMARNLKMAIELNKQIQHIKKPTSSLENELIVLYSDTKKESVSIPISSLLFIESRGNYIDIHSINNGKVQIDTLRTTLKLIESSSHKFYQLMRCHRGFLVNTLNVSHVSGNSQAYRLSFKETDIEIPLARSCAKEFQEHLSSCN